MRWISRDRKRYDLDGTVRIIEVFLLLPKCINEQWRWLEKVKIKQKYETWNKLCGFYYGYILSGAWNNIEWLN